MTDQTTAQPGTGTTTAAPTADIKLDTSSTETKPATETLVGGTGATTEEVKQTAPADWPEDWRPKLAGDDKKSLDRLGRFTSPADLFKSYRALEQRVSSGELKAQIPYPEKGTDAEKAAWRQEREIPSEPAGYKIELGNGMVVGEADKPVIDEFAKWAHANNWEPGRLNSTLQFYYQLQDQQAQQAKALDDTNKQATEDALRAEFGGDYRRYTNAVENLLGSAPGELGKLLIGGRLADGTLIGNDARVIKFLTQVALDLNPAATLVPAGVDQSKGVDGELGEIRKFRQENPDKYDQDKKLQERELELLNAQSKLRGRAA